MDTSTPPPRPRRDFYLWLSTLALAVTQTGCITSAPPPAQPEAVASLPAVYGDHGAVESYSPERWWMDFDDPVLNELVDEVLTGNLDVSAAAARLDRARAEARLARARLVPSLDVQGSPNYADSPVAGSGFNLPSESLGGADASDRLTTETYSLSLAASYELDLFGRLRNEAAAAAGNVFAAREDLRSLKLAAAAETISTYLDIVETRRQIELSLETVDVLGERVLQTEERFRSGLAESFELYQVRQDFRTAQTALPAREAQLSSLSGVLALLLGLYPGEIEARLDRPLRPRLSFEPVPPGLPIDLLAKRPDVAAAWYRLEASRLRVGARRAERYPRLQLSSVLGGQSDDPIDVFDIVDSWFLQIAANLTAPIFQGGRIEANIDASEASYAEAASSYARIVLNGYREVVSALDRYEENRQRYLLIHDQLEAAEATRRVQSLRFQKGVGSYIGYLDALRAVYQVTSSLSTASREVAVARLDIHRALGGHWFLESESTPEPLRWVPLEASHHAQEEDE